MRHYKYGTNRYIDKLLQHFKMCKEPRIKRTNSYINTIREKHCTIEEQCKKSSDKIEFAFSMMFVIVFIIFCLVINIIQPEY